VELELIVKDRNVKFSLGKSKGEGLESLIKIVSQDFDNVVVKGETKSYSFLRQICLFINLLIALKQVKLVVKSGSFEVNKGVLLPVYE
jgi:hypothetical protein